MRPTLVIAVEEGSEPTASPVTRLHSRSPHQGLTVSKHRDTNGEE